MPCRTSIPPQGVEVEVPEDVRVEKSDLTAERSSRAVDDGADSVDRLPSVSVEPECTPVAGDLPRQPENETEAALLDRSVFLES